MVNMRFAEHFIKEKGKNSEHFFPYVNIFEQSNTYFEKN